MIYHAFNPIENPSDSNLSIAQQIALESLIKSKIKGVKLIGISNENQSEIAGFDSYNNLKRKFKTKSGKTVPFIKDIFSTLSEMANDDDWIGYTNSDIIIKSSGFYKTLSKVKNTEAVFFNRDEVKTPSIPSSLEEFLVAETIQNPFEGRDGFFMKKKAWELIKDLYGDYIISQPYWDIDLIKSLENLVNTKVINNQILHYFHPKRWHTHSDEASRNKKIFNNKFNKKLPLISVIVTSYNKEKYIEQTLYTVDRQFTKGKFRYEVIVVDDCSTDNSFQIIQNFNWDNPDISNITILKNRVNKGVSYSYLKGLKASTGDFIVPIDGDDLMTRYSLLFRYDAIESDKSKNWATGQQLIIQDTNYFVTGKEFNRKVEPQTKKEFLENYLTGILHIPASSTIFRRALLKKVFWIKEMRSSQDYALMVLLGSRAEIPVYFDDYVTIYRYHPDGSDASLYQRSIKSGLKVKDFTILYKKALPYLNTSQRKLMLNWIEKWQKAYDRSL